ncbi:MAG: glutaredoxin family protein [Deltaproteobacteria bacterium]|nr:glutaredoxin family protein [Deltaproteobacteria bacterium]
MAHKVHLYALSTCSHCKNTKAFLNDAGIDYTFVDVDLTQGDERRALIEEVKKYNSGLSFPTVVIDDEKVIVGFKKAGLEEALKSK